jgi:V/A-type H+/Na+-transporting ATPase subunit K
MDLSSLGMIGVACVLGFSAFGSAVGAGIAGQAAIGAWKRNYMGNKPASFLLMTFAAAPLTQTIYGFILLQMIKSSEADPILKLAIGMASGLAIGMSAVAQGKAGAASSDAFGETNKGFAQYLIIVGLCETVAIFVLAFTLVALG